MIIISTTVGNCSKNPLEEMEQTSQSIKESETQYLGAFLNDKMIYVHFQGKSFNITAIQIYAQTTDAKETEVDQFYEDLQARKNTKKKDVFFMVGDWNGKVESQEIPGVSGRFGLRIQTETGKRLTEF